MWIQLLKAVLEILLPWFIDFQSREKHTQKNNSGSNTALRDRLHDRVREHKDRVDSARGSDEGD